MRSFPRLPVLMALVSLFAVLTATAEAVTWDNSGDTAFTATGGAGTLSSTSVGLSCSGASATGTVPATTAGTALVISGTLTFSGCLLSGQSVGVDCGYRFTATSQSGSVASGGGGVACGVYLAGIRVCNITGAVSGSVSGSLTNPASPSTFAKLATSTGSGLFTTNGASNCPLGNGDIGHISPLTFTVSSGTGGGTPHLGPRITRTA